EQTRAQHRSVVGVFLAWAGEGILIEDVDRRKAGDFITNHLIPKGLKRKTVQRYVSSLTTLWTWLVARGLTAGNPWRNQALGKRSKRGSAAQGQWSDAALERILTASYASQYTTILHELVRLALVTGARLDELCALETRHVLERNDGWWITVHEGKT